MCYNFLKMWTAGLTRFCPDRWARCLKSVTICNYLSLQMRITFNTDDANGCQKSEINELWRPGERVSESTLNFKRSC